MLRFERWVKLFSIPFLVARYDKDLCVPDAEKK